MNAAKYRPEIWWGIFGVILNIFDYFRFDSEEFLNQTNQFV